MSGDLGREISVHKGTFLQGGQAWLYGILLLPFALLVPVGWIAALFQDGPGGLVAKGWGTFCVSGLVAVLGPLILALPILRWTQSARVYERGLVHWSLLGTTRVRAEEVIEIVHTIRRYKLRTVDELQIRRRGPRALFITGIDRAADLASVVHAWTRGQGAASGAAPGAWTPPGAGGAVEHHGVAPPLAQQAWPSQPGGWAPPAQQGGPPPQHGGWAPPAAQQGWAPAQQGWPPAHQGGPPPQHGGWAPPAAPQGWAPPAQQGWPPAHQGGPPPQQEGCEPPPQAGAPQQGVAQQGWPPAQPSSGWPPADGGNPESGR